MRGKLPPSFRLNSEHRITPARAGKTPCSICSRMLRKDHPRACGENAQLEAAKRVGTGSPPRVRGKRTLWTRSPTCTRITPARAGKTDHDPTKVKAERDHPRACGENEDGLGREQEAVGSPPRVRGKHFGNGVFPWLILVLSLDPL